MNFLAKSMIKCKIRQILQAKKAKEAEKEMRP